MNRARASRFPPTSNIVDWDITVTPSGIKLDISKPGEPPFVLVLQPEDAYDLREDIGDAYDRANGI
jgi:hypothetical protein